MLAKPPDEISVGERVELLEGGIDLVDCIEDADTCGRSDICLTRGVWETATRAMHRELYAITLSDMISDNETAQDVAGDANDCRENE